MYQDDIAAAVKHQSGWKRLEESLLPSFREIAQGQDIPWNSDVFLQRVERDKVMVG